MPNKILRFDPSAGCDNLASTNGPVQTGWYTRDEKAGLGGCRVRNAQSMENAVGRADTTLASPEEDGLRAMHYRLLARFLTAAPTAEDLRIAAGLSGAPDTPLGQAVQNVAEAARGTDEASEQAAYQTLFIGLGRGLLVPFGSYYLTGFLHEKPLARLRQDMAEMGIARSDDVSDPEDHIASVLEMMAGLIAGDFGPLAKDAEQRFFDNHVASWAGHFFRDLALDKTSEFYASLGALGVMFMEVESHAFKLT